MAKCRNEDWDSFECDLSACYVGEFVYIYKSLSTSFSLLVFLDFTHELLKVNFTT